MSAVVFVCIGAVIASSLLLAVFLHAIEVDARKDAERDRCEGDWPFIPTINSPVHDAPYAEDIQHGRS